MAITLTGSDIVIEGKSIGTGDQRLVRAYVCFNGVSPITIYCSYNISSVTYLSPGHYQINYSEAISESTNYNILAGSGIWGFSFATALICPRIDQSTNTYCNLNLGYLDTNGVSILYDSSWVSVAIFCNDY